VKQAERLAEIFNRHRPDSAECVFGHTQTDDRAKIFRRFADRGRLQILVNVAVAGEGYDNPNIEAIVCAKPTKSRSRYTQNVGRGLRPLDGILRELNSPEERRMAIAASTKPNCVVLDFVGNSGRHSLMTVADVLGGRISEEAKKRAEKEILKTGRGNVLDELSRAEKNLRDEAEKRKRVGIVADATHRLTYVDPFEAFKTKAQYWSKHKQHGPLTIKQKQTLRKNGYNPDEFTPEQGQQIISKLFEMSPAQKSVLLRAGYKPDELSGIPKWAASKMIDAVKSNGWQRPKVA
jgi:type I site-specific restriction endonuclease